MKDLRKYDIVMVDLNPRKGHAQSGFRPSVIIQSNAFNRSSPTIIVVPLTSVEKKIFPSEFLINPSPANGLKKRSRFLGSQIMTVDSSFIVKKIGRLERNYFPMVREALDVALDWENEFI